MKTYAVLTGDIIGSTKLGPERLEAAMSLLRRLAKEFEHTHPESVVGQPDVFRGDSWQLCLKRPALAVTAAVFIRAGFKADDLDTRIGIGLGPVERLNESRISESSGPAFAHSGRTLDKLGKHRALALDGAGYLDVGGYAHPLVAGVGLLDAHIARWTQREAVAVYGALRNLSQDEIAALPQARTKEGNAPTRQAIQKALVRIYWASHLLPFLNEAVEILDLPPTL
ncbi:MAG: hypothetical protein WC661_19980 [Opitutaceae bacterium]|jgi:hypothetical protein